jgi:hypothetical protein
MSPERVKFLDYKGKGRQTKSQAFIKMASLLELTAPAWLYGSDWFLIQI